VLRLNAYSVNTLKADPYIDLSKDILNVDVKISLSFYAYPNRTGINCIHYEINNPKASNNEFHEILKYLIK